MKIKQCHPGCSWHVFNSARSFFKAKPERAIAVFPKAALCLCLCFSCRRAVMGCWLPRVAWLKSGCRGRGKRNRPRGAVPGLGLAGRGSGAAAGETMANAERYQWTAVNGFVESSRQRATGGSLFAEREGSIGSLRVAQTLTSTRLIHVPHA